MKLRLIKSNNMKNFINQHFKQLQNDGQTQALSFRTKADDIGHVQRDHNSWGSEWAIFFNSKCVHVTKTLNPVINKLVKLGVDENDFEIEI